MAALAGALGVEWGWEGEWELPISMGEELCQPLEVGVPAGTREVEATTTNNPVE